MLVNVLELPSNLFRPDPLEVLSVRVRTPSEKLLFIAAPDGRLVSNSRFYAKDRSLFFSEQVYVFLDFWPRPHEAHFSEQHIEELRKFVELVPTQSSAERSDPWIIATCTSATQLFSICDHCPEFPHSKQLPIASDADTSVKGRTWGGQPNADCYHKKKRRNEDEQNQRADQVEGSLNHSERVLTPEHFLLSVTGTIGICTKFVCVVSD